jgi:hypothetical protein
VNRGGKAAITAVALVGVTTLWTLLSPFPSLDKLAADSLLSLSNDLGRPTAVSALSAVWEKSRGLGVWSIRARWKVPHDFKEHPESVERCFRMIGAPEASSFCEFSAWTTVVVTASNNRRRGP